MTAPTKIPAMNESKSNAAPRSICSLVMFFAILNVKPGICATVWISYEIHFQKLSSTIVCNTHIVSYHRWAFEPPRAFVERSIRLQVLSH